MAETEVRRASAVVFGAIELVREGYRGLGEEGARSEAGRLLERVGQRLWEVMSYLVAEGVERRVGDLKRDSKWLVGVAGELKRAGGRSGVKGIRGGRGGGGGAAVGGVAVRELVEVLVDAGETLGALGRLVECGVEAGLTGG